MITQPIIGQNTDIDASAETLIPAVAAPVLVRYGTYVRALAGNGADIVYVGFTSGVLTTDGYPLPANAELFIPRAAAPDAAEIYVIGGNANLGVGYLII